MADQSQGQRGNRDQDDWKKQVASLAKLDTAASRVRIATAVSPGNRATADRAASRAKVDRADGAADRVRQATRARGGRLVHPALAGAPL